MSPRWDAPPGAARRADLRRIVPAKCRELASAPDAFSGSKMRAVFVSGAAVRSV